MPQDHPVFRRKGADLVIEKTLTLVEALCGFDFYITHMDKRRLRVKSNPGQARTFFFCTGVDITVGTSAYDTSPYVGGFWSTP